MTFRYQIEIVAPLWPRFWRMFTSETQKLRTRLGAHNDLPLLERLTEPHQPLARWRSRLRPAAQRHHLRIDGDAAECRDDLDLCR